MKVFVALVALASLLAFAQAQGNYGGAPSGFTFVANLSPQVSGDIAGVSGVEYFRTSGSDTLFFQSSLFGASNIIALDLHVTPQRGVIANGPLLLRLTNTSANPLSSNGGNLFQQGSRSTADLVSGAQIAQARAALPSLGITDNGIANIGDVDRLIRAGVVYADVHSTARLPPQVVVRGIVSVIPQSGRRLRAMHI